MTVSDTRHEAKEIADAAVALLPGRRIHELFETLAVLVPGTAAVVADGEKLSYRELDRRANRLARYLKSLGVGTEERVAVALERSVDAVVALLAVWKAGGTWIPLDLSWPPAPLGQLLEESGASFLVTREAIAKTLAAAAPAWPLQGLGELPPLWQLRIVHLDREADEIAGQGAAPVRSVAGPEHLACLLAPAGPDRPPGSSLRPLTHRELVQGSLGLAALGGGRPGIGHHLLRLAAGEALTLAEILFTLPQGATLHLTASGLPFDAACGRLLEGRAVTHLLLPPEAVRSWAAAGPLAAETVDATLAPGAPCALLREPAIGAVAGFLQAARDPG